MAARSRLFDAKRYEGCRASRKRGSDKNLSTWIGIDQGRGGFLCCLKPNESGVRRSPDPLAGARPTVGRAPLPSSPRAPTPSPSGGPAMKVVVDMNKCQDHGQCVFAAPDVFSHGRQTAIWPTSPTPTTRCATRSRKPPTCVRCRPSGSRADHDSRSARVSSSPAPPWPACAPPNSCGRRAGPAPSRVVGDEPHMPYNRPPLSKEVLAGQGPVRVAGLPSPGERRRRASGGWAPRSSRPTSTGRHRRTRRRRGTVVRRTGRRHRHAAPAAALPRPADPAATRSAPSPTPRACARR